MAARPGAIAGGSDDIHVSIFINVNGAVSILAVDEISSCDECGVAYVYSAVRGVEIVSLITLEYIIFGFECCAIKNVYFSITVLSVGNLVSYGYF